MPFEEKKKHTSLEDKPLVSIITPLYNAEKFIAETISSVQNQSYKNWEHIIVDDASSDNSILVVDSLAADENRIIFIKNSENLGAAVCRNQATELAGDIL